MTEIETILARAAECQAVAHGFRQMHRDSLKRIEVEDQALKKILRAGVARQAAEAGFQAADTAFQEALDAAPSEVVARITIGFTAPEDRQDAPPATVDDGSDRSAGRVVEADAEADTVGGDQPAIEEAPVYRTTSIAINDPAGRSQDEALDDRIMDLFHVASKGTGQVLFDLSKLAEKVETSMLRLDKALTRLAEARRIVRRKSVPGHAAFEILEPAPAASEAAE